MGTFFIFCCAARYGEEADAVRTYMNEGLEAALALPNRRREGVAAAVRARQPIPRWQKQR